MANLDYHVGALLCFHQKGYLPVVLVSLELGGKFRAVVELHGPRAQKDDESAMAVARKTSEELRKRGALSVLSAIVNDRAPNGAEGWQLILAQDLN